MLDDDSGATRFKVEDVRYVRERGRDPTGTTLLAGDQRDYDPDVVLLLLHLSVHGIASEAADNMSACSNGAQTTRYP